VLKQERVDLAAVLGQIQATIDDLLDQIVNVESAPKKRAAPKTKKPRSANADRGHLSARRLLTGERDASGRVSPQSHAAVTASYQSFH
jgi:hypothetical protein